MSDSKIPSRPPETVQPVLVNTDQVPPLQLRSSEGARYQLVIDGVLYTGQQTIRGKVIQLLRYAGNARRRSGCSVVGNFRIF